jgi:hypothetical protein
VLVGKTAGTTILLSVEFVAALATVQTQRMIPSISRGALRVLSFLTRPQDLLTLLFLRWCLLTVSRQIINSCRDDDTGPTENYVRHKDHQNDSKISNFEC